MEDEEITDKVKQVKKICLRTGDEELKQLVVVKNTARQVLEVL